MAVTTPLLPTDPVRVGPYRLEGRIGAGGQGTVYLGEEEDGRRTAVKLLHAHLITQETARTRFLDEFEIAKRVAPFCTAQVLDSGVLHGQPYIVSEFVDGPSLKESVLDTGPRGGAALERLALNTVTALAAIHEAGVVHRDFKPANVLLGPDGPVVIDFGIARALDLSQSLTGSQAVGTPGYIAPEYFQRSEAGPAADMFAWGATMAFAATGRRAFLGDFPEVIMHSVLYKEPDLEGMDGRLEAIVRACLAKDPALRPTAVEVGDRLRALPAPAWNTDGRLPPKIPDDEQDPEDNLREQTSGNGEQAQTTEIDPAGGSRRRLVQISAAALGVLAVAATAYFVSSMPRDGSPTPTRAAANATPDPPGSATPEAGPADAPVPSTASPSTSEHPAQEDTPKPSNPDTTEEPSGDEPSPSEEPAQPVPSPDRPSPSKKPDRPPSQPRTLGTITAQDYRAYCKAHGYIAYFYVHDIATCRGGDKDPTTVSATVVCRWLHPGQPNVRAEGVTCISSR